MGGVFGEEVVGVWWISAQARTLLQVQSENDW